MKILLRVLLLLLILAGCSKKEGQETERSSQQLNQTEELSEQPTSLNEIQFERETYFGSSNEVLIGRIATTGVDDKNRVYIADTDHTAVHVFNADGSYQTSLGRQGRGPGEFSAISFNTTIVADSSRLFITDTHRFYPHRANVYSMEDLSFSQTMNLIPKNRHDYDDLDKYYPKQLYPRSDGNFLVEYARSPVEYKDSDSSVRFMLQDSLGCIIHGPLLEQRDLKHLVYTNKTNLSIAFTFPFLRKSLLAISKNGYLYAVNDTEKFKIDVYDADGEFIRSFQHPFNHISLTRNKLIDQYKNDEDIDSLRKETSLQMIRNADHLPGKWPAIDQMLIDSENRLWVSTIMEDVDIREWWVLEDTGELITKFEWPRDEPLKAVRNGYMYTLATDEESGLQQVVKYRVEMN